MSITKYDAKAESGELIFYIKKEGGIGWPSVKEQTLKELGGRQWCRKQWKAVQSRLVWSLRWGRNFLDVNFWCAYIWGADLAALGENVSSADQIWMVNSETDGEPGRALDESRHRVLELKGLRSQKSFLQWCEPKVGTQQRSLLMLKLKSAAGRRMGELCRRSELSGE